MKQDHNKNFKNNTNSAKLLPTTCRTDSPYNKKSLKKSEYNSEKVSSRSNCHNSHTEKTTQDQTQIKALILIIIETVHSQTTAICFPRKIENEIFQIIEKATTQTTDIEISIKLTPSKKLER